MTKMTYREQLLHPNWQRKRLEVLESAAWVCSNCGGDDATLHVHHKRYIKGRMAWEYGESELSVLCAPCHSEAHANRDLLERILTNSLYGEQTVATACGLLAGYLAGDCALDPDIEAEAIKVAGNAYDSGLIGGMSSCSPWKDIAQAAKILSPGPMSPARQNAMDRWEGEQ